MLLLKYIYPYKYINYWEKFNETLLAEIVLSLFANGQRGVATLLSLKRNNSSRPSQRNMGLSLSKQDHNYSRLLSRRSQSRTRFWAPLSVRFKQKEVESNNFEVNILGSLNARHRFVSRVPYHIPTYLAWKPDSYSKGTDAFQQSWKKCLQSASQKELPLFSWM